MLTQAPGSTHGHCMLPVSGAGERERERETERELLPFTAPRKPHNMWGANRPDGLTRPLCSGEEEERAVISGATRHAMHRRLYS